MIRVVIIGAVGRMGRALVRTASEFPDLRITGAVDSPKSPFLGDDAGVIARREALGVKITSDLPQALRDSDVAIDFSSAAATHANLTACRQARKALFVGTTGLDADVVPELEAAAREIPLLVAPNTSIGVTLLIELVREAAQALPPEFDIEIVESHHRLKRDAPSGTALALGEAAADGRNQRLDSVAVVGRHGAAERKDGQIGFAVVRGGDIVGEHTVLFAGQSERLQLGHEATDRIIFARGALRGASWLAEQPPGRYFMRDVLGYKT
ncbi:MAG TPA: 4-hydroxy-tetrahydrodipicolinate reductase [Steroidobacteraceae bacterium]|nr:4-hydroxy-tetrahydrodipicolinate reductase [Steroidobacteraceae bacterium]